MLTRLAAAPLLGLVVLLAACSSGASPTTAPATPAPATPAPATPDGAPIGAPAAGGAAVNLASTSLGDVLVDGAGLTLYMFTADAGGSSACNGDCATNWPPLLSDAAPSLAAGLDSEDFASIARDDGTRQVTFYGMPLYTFAGDSAPGDVNGQGVGGKWYALGADGTVLKSGAPKGY